MKNILLAIMLATGSLVFAQEKTRIAVMDLVAKQGVSSQVTSSLADMLTTEISEMEMYQVINRDDMQTMLQHIADKQMLGCDDTKCLVQIGGALGVDMLLSGNIGMIGNSYLINIKLIDIDNAEVLNRISDSFIGDEAELITRIKTSVNRLLLSEAYRTRRKIRNIAIGTAAVTALAGGYFAFKGYDIHKNEYLTAIGNEATMEAKDRYEAMDMLRNISFGLTGVCVGMTFYFSLK